LGTGGSTNTPLIGRKKKRIYIITCYLIFFDLMISGSKDQKSVVGVSGVDMNKSKCDVMSYKSVDRQLNSHVRIGVEATTNISEFTLEVGICGLSRFSEKAT
jgi:hypothetical protein